MTRIRKSGGYRQLASFQTTTIIYDATVWFCEKFIDRFSRTGDQMVQAARSGRQNIAEGSRAGATSSQTELRLVNVARASLEELLLDFEDYLRHRHLTLWESDSAEARTVRQVAWGRKPDRSDQSDPTDPTDLTKLTDQQRCQLYSQWLDHPEPAVRANAVICLIHQANYLLDQQLDALEKQFINAGGYSEQLATARLNKRAEDRKPIAVANIRDSGPASPSEVQPPPCPRCGGLMALRTAKTGRNAGSQFWGCIAYPNCQGTAEL